MTHGKISRRIVAERIKWINDMLTEIKKLPLESYAYFSQDKKNIWAAESCLRRALEALMDLGRHVLAKGFGRAVVEYKEIATALAETQVLTEDESNLFRILAGYRNRMVHFYQEISDTELYDICSSKLSDISRTSEAIKVWIKDHADYIDQGL